MAADAVFGDLRKLADWFSTSPTRWTAQVERLIRKLGVTAVPLLGRELRHPDPRRRDAAREALALLASGDARSRVVDELRRATANDVAGDDTKVAALGLLSELGEHGEARFTDPRAMQRRSAIALAAQLDHPSDVACAADMMVCQLDDDDVVQMIEALYEAAPAAAYRLATELAARLDLTLDQRERIASIVTMAPSAGPERRPPRPTHVAVLGDAAGRIVVVASRKVSGERRWRRWAVLIDPAGRIDECLHEATTSPDASSCASLIATLCAEGYEVATSELERAREVVATAARITASEPDRLSSAYYLGRDLLDLQNAHLPRARRALGGGDPTALLVGRAIELIADDDIARARPLLDRCDPHNPDVAAALAGCALVDQRPADAVEPLARAIAAEPAWPLHHYNLGVALHQLGDVHGCYQAFRRFVATSAAPTALAADPDQPQRLAQVERMLGDLERTARLAGISLARRRRNTRSPAR